MGEQPKTAMPGTPHRVEVELMTTKVLRAWSMVILGLGVPFGVALGLALCKFALRGGAVGGEILLLPIMAVAMRVTFCWGRWIR